MVSGADKEENMVDEVDDDTSAKKENNCVFGALLQGEDVGKKALNINEMPEELLLEIFLHLPTQTALKVLFFFWIETKMLLRQLLAKKVFIIIFFFAWKSSPKNIIIITPSSCLMKSIHRLLLSAVHGPLPSFPIPFGNANYPGQIFTDSLMVIRKWTGRNCRRDIDDNLMIRHLMRYVIVRRSERSYHLKSDDCAKYQQLFIGWG